LLSDFDNGRTGGHRVPDRASTASRVAEALREQIADGAFRSGERMPEERIAASFGVSRNTLREAFQLLTRERLLVHRLNRGMFVRELTADDVADLYRVRRLIECGALREAETVPVRALRDLHAAVEAGQRAAAAKQWADVGTASIHFHQAITSISGSPRAEEIMRRVLAEFRLAYAMMRDPRSYHEPYLRRHPGIVEAVGAGKLDHAEDLLRRYLGDAERQLLRAYAGLPDPPPSEMRI
jgi:DNA-binding GntR family transcriptional regulator